MVEIPLSVLIGVGSGLVTAVVFIFRLLITSQEKRLAATMEHHERFVAKAEVERQAAAADRERYIAQLEKLVTGIAADRNTLQDQMIRTVTANTEALAMNTRAREVATFEVEKLMKEVSGAVIVKLVDIGLLPVPSKTPPKPAA